jgi:acyl-CoA synthetase (AMP-forming)/AMP-acid ligase II/acyl carrier protein
LIMVGTVRKIIDHEGLDLSSTALLSIDGGELNYRKLHEQVSYTVSSLNAIGLKPTDRIAIVLPNGPIMATALLSVASGFACAPLNPALREDELEQQLSDIQAKCVVVQSGEGGAAVAVAAKNGVEVLELVPKALEAGAYDIRGVGREEGKGPTWTKGDDVALMMHTSGTTAKPKLVGLTNSVVAHSVTVIRERLGLTPADCSINLLPLFHVHGQTMVLTSLLAGGSVVCAPGFDASRFLAWLAKFRPTWYSAVPTMHRAILDLCQDGGSTIPKGRLRFIRSASSALPVQLILDMERVFGVPVIEAYGMTEASHGIASNLLPPGKRKPGSVGLPYRGEEIAIGGGGEEPLGPQETGEILIRGNNVIESYLENPEANTKSFTKGWLKTGDLGYLDDEGYLYIVGRVKDIINRGGEKVSPREVEEAILAIGAVSQAIVFPVPHPTLGEDVAAAVVLKGGQSIHEDSMRMELARVLARHKVPQRIFIVGEIPKSPVGKPQRWEMAKKLGIGEDKESARGALSSASGRQPTEVEKKVLGIWREVLRTDRVGLEERFLEAGGDSLRATQVASRLRMEFGVEVDVAALLEVDSIAGQARLVEKSTSEKALGLKTGR